MSRVVGNSKCFRVWNSRHFFDGSATTKGRKVTLDSIDLLVVGSGPVGAMAARVAAEEHGLNCLVVERRGNVGGHCFDRYHESGVLIHEYGPHYFRTNSDELFQRLSSFTEWLPGRYFVKSYSRGQLFTLPISLITLEEFFGRSFTMHEAEDLLASLREPIDNPRNSEEFVLSRVGRELYEAFYVGYTQKQWSKHPRELAPSVCGRVPIRYNRDPRYVGHKHQVMPKWGYTRLFENLLKHPKIKVLLQADYAEVRGCLMPRMATIYTGAIDEYFEYALGRLAWRSLEFAYDVHDEAFVQPCVQINYPNDFDYTRTVEVKHVTRQEHPKTVVAREYARAEGPPYYPVPAEENYQLYERYAAKAAEERTSRRVYFAGRLAEYTYIDMDVAFLRGLDVVSQIIQDSSKAVL